MKRTDAKVRAKTLRTENKSYSQIGKILFKEGYKSQMTGKALSDGGVERLLNPHHATKAKTTAKTDAPKLRRGKANGGGNSTIEIAKVVINSDMHTKVKLRLLREIIK